MTAVGEGREAEILPWDDGRVVRLLRDPERGGNLDREAVVMRAAAAAGVPVPAVYEVVSVDGRPGLVMERIDGGDLMSALGRQPWKLLAAAGRLGRLQAELNGVAAPAELDDLHEALTGRIGRADLDEASRGRALELLATLPAGDRICHGDFHPGNVLWSGDGPMIIDWTNAAAGDPTADHARTMLLLGVGVIPGEQSALARFVDRAGRRGFQALWRRAYRRAAARPPERFDDWYTVWAAARLAEGITEERDVLRDIVGSGLEGR